MAKKIKKTELGRSDVVPEPHYPAEGKREIPKSVVVWEKRVEYPMTAKQIAKFLDISVPTLRRKCQRGELPYYRVTGRKFLFMPSEVVEALRTKKKEK